MRVFNLTVAILILLIIPATAADNTAFMIEQLKAAKGDLEKSRVINVIDGDTLQLENKREVRLVGIQAPKIALGRENFTEWPLGYEAKDALEEITLNKTVALYFGGREMDRYGRTLAHLFLDDGSWVQGEMLRRGMARVYSFADNRSIVSEMLAAEQEAFDANLGIWSFDYYKIIPQEISGKFTNSFQIISGQIKEVTTVRNITYLNFGDDYRKDFTIVVPSRAKRMFDQKDINLSDLKNKNIFVRGWLKYYNGPSIELTHPEQLVIDEQES